MPKRKPGQPTADEQHPRFVETARELGCDEDETAFDGALKKVAESGPVPKREPRRRRPDTQALIEHALYLINELASAIEQTKVADWPEDQADLFRKRLREISAKAE